MDWRIEKIRIFNEGLTVLEPSFPKRAPLTLCMDSRTRDKEVQSNEER
jgi:hypothetical protein